MNKPVCLGLSLLEISKVVMCELQYDDVKLKYEKKCKIRLHGYSLLKTEDIDVDIAKDVETRLYASLPK